MITIESKESRRIVGRLESGSHLVDDLLAIAKKYKIHTGNVQAIGYLSSAQLVMYDAKAGSHGEVEDVGMSHVISLNGNLSALEGETVLHLQALLLETDGKKPEVRAGRLRNGVVMEIEFVMDTVDDFRLIRSTVEGDLYPWLQIMPSDAANESKDTGRTEYFPGRMANRSRYNMPDYDLQADDRLNHSRLGLCTVMSVPDNNHATIRLENGRVVDLHLGLFELEPTKENPKGAQVYNVRMRKRS